MSYSLEAIFNGASWSIATQSKALSDLQTQAATGQEINRVSDNPTDANRILNLKAESRSNKAGDVIPARQMIDSFGIPLGCD